MFRFKQFTVEDSHSSMKVGTDAVLLGSLATQGGSNTDTVLDIGTGCGVVSLLVAQQCPFAQIQAIDIDAASVEEARHNFLLSPWRERLQVRQISLQTHVLTSEQRYNLIVSNPPYFSQSLKGSESRRNQARHNDTLPFADLVSGIDSLMAPDGRFCCILPCRNAEEVIVRAQSHNLHCIHRVLIRTRQDLPIKRTIFTLARNNETQYEEITLVLREKDNTPTVQYKNLTKEFYLDI